MSVYLVDPSLSQDQGTFEKSMIYLTTFTNEFFDMDVDVEAMIKGYATHNAGMLQNGMHVLRL